MSNPIINPSGTKVWLNDQQELHREDGPAVEYANGDKCWYRHDKLHREDGPAIILDNGKQSWYYRDRYIPCQDTKTFHRLLKLKAFL